MKNSKKYAFGRREKLHLTYSVCVYALALSVLNYGTIAFAQNSNDINTVSPAAPQASNQPIEEIVTTGSRLTGNFVAPTPTTTIGSEYAEMRASANVASILNEMPSFKASHSPQTSSTTSANGGSNFLNLRSLGPQRTLILVNGRRHVPTTSAGLVDLNAIPVNLLSRIDVVTGGASAAYGSDAVAGVVNLILDEDFVGFKSDA